MNRKSVQTEFPLILRRVLMGAATLLAATFVSLSQIEAQTFQFEFGSNGSTVGADPPAIAVLIRHHPGSRRA